MANNIFILAGEKSGDIHAANLAGSILALNPKLKIYGWGGSKMERSGVSVLKDLKDLAFMGFWEVLVNLKKIKSNFKECKSSIIQKKIDVLILVDYPGFNLRIAKWAKSKNIKVIYYISPQVWAWKKSRVHIIKRYVDEMYCILPFEKDFYAQFDVNVQYFGHPLLDEINSFRTNYKSDYSIEEKPVLAILPGSRKQELERKLSIMLKAALLLKDKYKIVVACAENIEASFFEKYKNENVDFVFGETYRLLSQANIAIVTSGTATLETALFNVPQVVCYKSSWISFHIAKRLIKVKYISLVNLILDDKAVEELIQHQCNVKNILEQIRRIESGKPEREIILNKYSKLVQLLGVNGASNRIAKHFIENL